MAGCWGEERKVLSKKLHQLLVVTQEPAGAATEALLEAAAAHSREDRGWYSLRRAVEFKLHWWLGQLELLVLRAQPWCLLEPG